MKFLLIGGPSFLGIHAINSARTAGHSIVMFNRGLTNPQLFRDVPRIQGDRTNANDLAQLHDHDFDAVIDTCGFDHRVVAKTLDVLRGRDVHYTFISSISAYADGRSPRRESDPLAPLVKDPDVPEERPYGGSVHYGPLKARCEQVVTEAFPESSVSIRLTLGMGPDDYGRSTHRGAYWAQRVRDYETVLVPGPATRLLSLIDVRDMMDFVVRQAEVGGTGPFNLASPAVTVHDLLTLCKGIYGTTAELVYVDPGWLLERGVRPNLEVPWWVPGDHLRYQFAIDPTRALSAGLELRPLEETIRDSVAWCDAHPAIGELMVFGGPGQPGVGSEPRPAFLSRDRELDLLNRWRAHRSRN